MATVSKVMAHEEWRPHPMRDPYDKKVNELDVEVTQLKAALKACSEWAAKLEEMLADPVKEAARKWEDYLK